MKSFYRKHFDSKLCFFYAFHIILSFGASRYVLFLKLKWNKTCFAFKKYKKYMLNYRIFLCIFYLHFFVLFFISHLCNNDMWMRYYQRFSISFSWLSVSRAEKVGEGIFIAFFMLARGILYSIAFLWLSILASYTG